MEVREVVLDRPVERSRRSVASCRADGLPLARPPLDRAARGPTRGPPHRPGRRRASRRARRCGPRGRAARPPSPSVRPARAWRCGSARRRGRRSAADESRTGPGGGGRGPTASARSGSALRPPIPVSTSSNTSVGVASASARTRLIARATRDSSPPEAIRASGRGGSPGFGASRYTTWSMPAASKATASPSTSTAGSPGPAGRRPTRDLEDAGRETRAPRGLRRRPPVSVAAASPRAADSAAGGCADREQQACVLASAGGHAPRRDRAAARPRPRRVHRGR